ncbi:hypothetical protein [Paenisporosarcina sp. OV554]|uniref:hypothetical protein n=1 Tax=Paenisporosarcina sp. OV554 TaxID=2135694 RepID=UPI0035144316
MKENINDNTKTRTKIWLKARADHANSIITPARPREITVEKNPTYPVSIQHSYIHSSSSRRHAYD